MKRRLLAPLLLLASALAGAEPPLVFIAARNHAEPLSRWDARDRLTGGILLDLGDLIARELGRQAHYLSLPSKRAPQGLRNGQGDLICYSHPDWIGRDGLHWTPLFIANAYVIAAHASAPPLPRLEDLVGQRVGTVLGYRYGEIESRAGFRREDAPDMGANLRKLAAGRLRYALTDLISLQAAQREAPQQLREALRLDPFQAGCALSRRSKLAPAQLDAAIQALQRRGEIERLLARYR